MFQYKWISLRLTKSDDVSGLFKFGKGSTLGGASTFSDKGSALGNTSAFSGIGSTWEPLGGGVFAFLHKDTIWGFVSFFSDKGSTFLALLCLFFGVPCFLGWRF